MRLKFGMSETTRSGTGLAPVALQPPGHRAAAEADDRLQELELLREAGAPAARQASVVDVLPLHPRGLAEDILRIEDFHQVDETHLPRSALLANDRLERRGGGPMSAARIEIDQVDCLHRARAMRHVLGCLGRKHGRGILHCQREHRMKGARPTALVRADNARPGISKMLVFLARPCARPRVRAATPAFQNEVTMSANPRSVSLSHAQARVDLAACYRLADHFGLNEGIDNHMTMLVPGHSDRFLLAPFGLHWSEVRASDFMVVDFGGQIVSGRGPIEDTALYIHLPVHRSSPKARCVLHTHMPYATALSMLENPRLEMAVQSALGFYEDVAYDLEYNGLAFDETEGERLARALGDKSVLLMGNHGALVVGRDRPAGIRAALFLRARLPGPGARALDRARLEAACPRKSCGPRWPSSSRADRSAAAIARICTSRRSSACSTAITRTTRAERRRPTRHGAGRRPRPPTPAR